MKERVTSYDAFRGVLLLSMVIFHILVNLTGWVFEQEFFYWVPMGFILFLGVVLGQFLVGKTFKKLSLGFKLLVLFLGFNAPTFYGGVHFADFLRGDSTLFSFEILLPMAVLIFSTILWDQIRSGWKILLGFSFGLLLILNYWGVESYNLSFLLYGLLGYFLSLGCDLDAVAKRFRSIPALFPLLVLALFPFAAIAAGHLYDFVVIFQVLALYFLFTLLESPRFLVFLGQHSLVLYVAHIVVIRLLVQIF